MFTYPYWSVVPVLYIMLAAWLVMLITFEVGSELYARFRGWWTGHRAPDFNGGNHHQPQPS